MKKLLLLGALALCLGYVSAQICQAQAAINATAFVNVNVVPMDKERVLYNQTVIVRDGRIAEIGDAAKVKLPKTIVRIDGRGKFLMPGLVDMHTHLNSPQEFPLYLANGVTTVYNLNGQPAHLLWREKIVKGEMLAPTVYTCGPTIRTAKTAEEARRIVEEQARAGYDSIKIYSLVSKEAYPVLVEEARKRKMLVVGHIPREPKFADVMKSGMAIAHAEEFGYTVFNFNFDDFSRLPEVAKQTRENNVPVILTLVAFDHIIRQAEDLPALLAMPEIKYLAPWIRAEWQPGKNLYQQRFSNAQGISGLKKSFALQKKLVQAFREAGVKIMVGTDAMNMGVVPGFSVHEELRNLSEIGFTPYEALQAATQNPAEFLQTGEFGTVSVGRRADLILLDGNPLEDISRATRPAGVMTRGRWLPANALRRMLDEVPSNYATEEQFVKANFARDTPKILNYLSENDPFNNLLNEAVANLVAEKGAGEFRKVFGQVKSINPKANLAQEDFVNNLGYRLLGRNKTQEAIEIFKFNIEAYPKSGNTYDSLAETYLANGEKNLAFEFYKKALEIEPNYPNAKTAAEILKKLEAELKTASPK